MYQLSIKRVLIFFLSGIILFSCGSPVGDRTEPQGNFGDSEVIYHVFQRSFYDSDGDQNGDLNGLREKLDYLQDLGITSIQLLPLYQSVFYHNYFTDDFYKIDSTLGSMQDYTALVKEVHRRGMKIFMDMETQYVTGDHPWYKDSYNNLHSPYRDYLVWKDSAHTQPESIVMNLTELKGYNGIIRKLIPVNLKNPEVLKYNIAFYSFWLDPNKDGKFDDGVDGFRFDHMMDNLDYKPQLTHLFNTFWKPLIEAIKKVNPKIVNVAEQADWNSWAVDYLPVGVDRVYSFKLMGGIRSFNKKYLTSMADSAFSIFPDAKHEVIFIENHDLPRFSNGVQRSIPKLKIGAALNLLIGGVPSIYYGQELGMDGKGEWNKWGMTDANEIPDREAFEWYKADTGRGMALWYKNSGPWWDARYSKPDDGISLEEEKGDSGSIYNFYRKMIRLRKSNPVISTGKYETLENSSDSVFSFRRYDSGRSCLVVLNLSGSALQVDVHFPPDLEGKNLTHLNGTATPTTSTNKMTLGLSPYDIEVFEMKP